MKIKTVYKLAVVMAVVITLLLPATHTAFAADPARQVSLTLSFHDKGLPIPDAAFSVWKIADRTADGAASPAGAFAQLDASFADLSASGLASLASAAAEFAKENGVSAQESGKTDQNGTLKLSTVNAHGLYLVTGEPAAHGEYIYTPTPFVAALPGTAADGSALYDAAVEVKYTKSPQSETTAPTTEPTTPSTEPTTPSTEPTAPPTTSPGVPTTSPGGRTPGVTPKDPGKLPQTGTLLWLVPVLVAVGGALTVFGIILRKKAQDE